MNARHSHFTSRALLVVLGACLCAQAAFAQSHWADGINIAGEAVHQELGHEAEASVGGTFTSGNFRAPSMGKTVWSTQAEAAASSAYEDLYLTGVFGFDLSYGTGMMGSMFSDPGFYPIDVLEFTPGDKVKQTYSIGGGFAWKNGSRWTPGATAFFQGVNYAKRKDLRHTTYRQEFEIAPSIHYRGDAFEAGITGIFRKDSEFITAEQVGQAKADSYMAFLDKGMRYGTMQVWDGSGIHLNEAGVNRLPVKQYTYGAAIQASYGKLLYGDIQYTRSTGEVGEKGYIWFRFPGNNLETKLILTIPGNGMVHNITAAYEWHSMENNEVVTEKVTEGGVTTPRIYGSNTVFRHRDMSAGVQYALGHKNGWRAMGGISFEHARDLSTLMYPYFDDDRSLHMALSAGGAVSLGRFLIRANLRYVQKIGERSHVVDVADASLGVKEPPTRLQDWWDREQEAADATRFVVIAAVRYSFPSGIYLEANTFWIHAFKVVLISGNDRQTSGLKLGYNF